jgi:hypothetical protein
VELEPTVPREDELGDPAVLVGVDRAAGQTDRACRSLGPPMADPEASNVHRVAPIVPPFDDPGHPDTRVEPVVDTTPDGPAGRARRAVPPTYRRRRREARARIVASARERRVAM